jgi:putative transposase
MSRKYKFHNLSGIYFISFATVNWIDVCTRQIYFDVFVDSLSYCRNKKGMDVFAYCIMPSHVHLVFRSTNNDPSGLIRDLKGFTARKLLKAIKENPQESRKEWMFQLFKKAGNKNSNVTNYQFWQQHNKPIELWSEKVIQQKIDYIHNNPVESGFVTEAIEWKYSSAKNYMNKQGVIDIDI